MEVAPASAMAGSVRGFDILLMWGHWLFPVAAAVHSDVRRHRDASRVAAIGVMASLMSLVVFAVRGARMSPHGDLRDLMPILLGVSPIFLPTIALSVWLFVRARRAVHPSGHAA